MSNVSVPGLHDGVMGSAGGDGSHGHHCIQSRSGFVLVGNVSNFYHFKQNQESRDRDRE